MPSTCEHAFVSGAAHILHADLDAFYASVEQRDDPRLRGRPVIVGSGVVLAASYEAKAYGVRTAMGGPQARRLCPQAIVVEPRMPAYAEASKAVFELFEQTTPLVEGLSIDEAFLDVRGLERVSGTPVEIAARLRVGTGLQACPSRGVPRFERAECIPLAHTPRSCRQRNLIVGLSVAAQRCDRRTRNRLRLRKPAVIFGLAKIWPREQLLQTDHVRSAPSGLRNSSERLVNVRLLDRRA